MVFLIERDTMLSPMTKMMTNARPEIEAWLKESDYKDWRATWAEGELQDYEPYFILTLWDEANGFGIKFEEDDSFDTLHISTMPKDYTGIWVTLKEDSAAHIIEAMTSAMNHLIHDEPFNEDYWDDEGLEDPIFTLMKENRANIEAWLKESKYKDYAIHWVMDDIPARDNGIYFTLTSPSGEKTSFQDDDIHGRWRKLRVQRETPGEMFSDFDEIYLTEFDTDEIMKVIDKLMKDLDELIERATEYRAKWEKEDREKKIEVSEANEPHYWVKTYEPGVWLHPYVIVIPPIIPNTKPLYPHE